MATRGFLIRFIDIGLIVLFGFLMISDIEASSRVELAGSEASTDTAPEPEEAQAFVVVEIAADGAFVVRESPAPPEDAGSGVGRVLTTGVESGETVAVADSGVAPGEEAAAVADSVMRVGSAAGTGELRVGGAAALTEALRRLAASNEAAGRRTVVLIEPHPASEVQRTVDVMDVCDRLGLTKSLRMDIEVMSGPR